jgi:hypothetical protein
MGPLLILAGVLLLIGYTLVYLGAVRGSDHDTSFREALLGGLSFAGAKA